MPVQLVCWSYLGAIFSHYFLFVSLKMGYRAVTYLEGIPMERQE